MKKILSLMLAVFMMLSFVSCKESKEEDNGPKVEAPLLGKTPKELYDEAIEYVKALTNYEILIETNYKTAYKDEIDEENSTTLHCCTGDTFSYSYKTEFYDEFFIHDGTMLYRSVNNVQEKSDISYDEFMASWGSITEDGLLIPLEESMFEKKMFIHDGEFYSLNLQITEEEYAEITGGSVEAPVKYQVYFNSEGKLSFFERSMVYYYDMILVEDSIKVTLANIGTTEKITAPEGVEKFPVRLKAEEIDLSSVESLDAFESDPSTVETDYVLFNIKIDGPFEIVKKGEGDAEDKVETVENYQGKIVVRLFPEVAPVSVSNFKSLVGHTFYDDLIFHRVVKDFVIQGGDPKGTGIGGADNTIFGEFSSNGFTNNLSHKRGVVSMARSDDPDSASSQFFICQSDAKSLDGKYAAFGYVVYGMDVVDFISSVVVDESDKPKQNVVIEKATFLKKK